LTNFKPRAIIQTENKRKGDNKMSNYRESLINRMINLYGYEHPAVIKFAELAEYWRGGDNVLRVIVESHEAYPLED
jgi:hypothetical protein